LIPKQVSPGYLNFEAPNYANVKNFKWVHLAAVPKGAFEKRSTVYASCLGGNECINHLAGASVASLDKELRQSYCPVGASENLLTSHDILKPSDTSMSANATTEPVTNKPTPVVSTTPTPPQATPKGAPITTGTPTKGIVRLKDKNASVTPQSNSIPNTNQPAGEPDELTKLREEFQTMQEWKQQQERREQIKRKVPKELFINKGKFDEKGYEAEVEKRLQSGATDEQLDELYTMMIEKQKLINAGFQLPNQNPTPEGMEMPMQAPTGGGAYKTSTEVPTGGSAADSNNYVNSNIRELLSRFIVRTE
jgi:hypothetical protein